MLPNSQFPADLVTLTEEIHNGKCHFLCSGRWYSLHPMRLKLGGSHLTYKVASKCLNVCERVIVAERKVDGRLSSRAVQLFVNVLERKF